MSYGVNTNKNKSLPKFSSDTTIIESTSLLQESTYYEHELCFADVQAALYMGAIVTPGLSRDRPVIIIEM